MPKWTQTLFLCLFMLLANGQLRSMICGGDVTDLGDYKFEVLRKCGEPQIQEAIGYRVNRRGDREMIIEQWVYGPRRGLYYILQFEGGRLKKIDTRINR